MSSVRESSFEIVDNKKGKSAIWTHFGFVKSCDEIDKTRIACKLCRTTLKFSGNTTNLSDHIRRKHPTVNLKKVQNQSSPQSVAVSHQREQPHISGFFANKLPRSSQRSNSISDAILTFIVEDLRPFSVVENSGFKKLLHVMEPRYTIPSRQYFSDSAMPDLYQSVKKSVLSDLSKATSVAITTDGWTSRATESYITVTSSHIDSNWKLKNYVLQTRSMAESHTGVNVASVLREAIEEWGLPANPPIVTDNASNMTVAAREAGLTLHIGCFAHTLNLACGKALKLGSVSKLLARVRKIVSYFHRSTVAYAVLKEKQKLLSLPEHKLIIDVQTRWNSALDMLSRFLEQQAAVYAALTSKDLHGKEKDISSLSESDISGMEEVITVLQPLKTATVALCEESNPTLSIVIPLKHQLISSIMKVNDDDSEVVKQIKKAVHTDLSPRYEDNKQKLTLATVLDPRFKLLPFLSEESKLNVFHELTLECISVNEALSKRNADKLIIKEEASDDTSQPPLPKVPNLEPVNLTEDSEEPVEKKPKMDTSSSSESKNAMGSLFGDIYFVKEEKIASLQERAENEVFAYRKEDPISTGENPLHWWSDNEHKYPLLSAVGKKYLSIPATSVPSERVFSTAGDIVTAQRSALKSQHVDKLIFLKKNRI